MHIHKLFATLLLLLTVVVINAQDSAHFNSDTAIRMNDQERRIEPEITYPVFKGYPHFDGDFYFFSHFIPRGWRLKDSVRGDLDDDGRADLVLVIEYKETVHEKAPGDWDLVTRPRVLLLLMQKKETKLYRLALQNNHIIPRIGEGKGSGDPYNKLHLQQGILTLEGPMGGQYSFRWRNDDFYLISASTTGIKSPKTQYGPLGEFHYDTSYYYHINYLTGKVLSKKRLMDGGESDQEFIRRFAIKRRRLKRLRDLDEFDERKLFRGVLR